MSKEPKQVGVIGGGIIGICTALFLQRAGFNVTIIDKEGIAKACSQGNAGHFATEQVFPLADISLLKHLPKMLIDPLGPLTIKPRYLFKAIPWFIRFICQMTESKYRYNQHQLRLLNRHAMPAYSLLLDELNLEYLITHKGSILTFETTPDTEIKSLLDKFQQQGIKVKWLDKKELQTIEPNVSDNVTSAFLFNTGAHSADPEAFCIALAEQFLSKGGQLVIDQIEGINTNDGILLTGEMHSYHFDKLVVASGAWSKALASMLGFNIPLDTERGYHLMVEKTGIIDRPIASAERKFIMTPMAKGLRLAGTVEFAGLNAPLNKKRADILLPHAKSILKNLPEAPISQPWMGCRPSLPDSLPVIGQSPKSPNVYFAFGHHHLGLTHGAITGKLIAEQMTEQPTTLNLTPFCISRF